MSVFADIFESIANAVVEPFLNRWFESTSARVIGWVFAAFLVGTVAAVVLLPGDARWVAGVCGGLLTGCWGLLWLVKRWQEREP